VARVAHNRRALKAALVASFKPQLTGRGDGFAGTVGNVRAAGQCDRRAGLIGLGVVLAFKRLEPALAVGVGVADDPALFDFAVRGDPLSFSDRHWYSLSEYRAT
jgi:hypothetical protein